MPCDVPVSCYLNVKSHFDIEQVLVFPKVASHLTLGVPQIILQLPNVILKSNNTNPLCRPNWLTFIEIEKARILNSAYTLKIHTCPSAQILIQLFQDRVPAS